MSPDTDVLVYSSPYPHITEETEVTVTNFPEIPQLKSRRAGTHTEDLRTPELCMPL